MAAAPVRRCAKCEAEGITTRRKIVINSRELGPLCATHKRQHLANKRNQRKSAHVERTYSITEKQYQAILNAQGGWCYICHRKPGRKRLSVDHDHQCCSGTTSCGQCVRGLLCSTCNKYLGHIRDDPEAAERAGAYLRMPPAYSVLPRV